MLEQSLPKTAPSLYDRDFVLWTEQMATALREGRLHHLDLKNLAEEIESLGRSERRALQSRLVVLLAHLLKWQYQPVMRTGSWKATITEQRRRIRVLLQDSPSLHSYLIECFAEFYQDARRQAADETGLAIAQFPTECQQSIENVLDPDFLPSS